LFMTIYQCSLNGLFSNKLTHVQRNAKAIKSVAIQIFNLPQDDLLTVRLLVLSPQYFNLPVYT
jgi:hypothetical protein